VRPLLEGGEALRSSALVPVVEPEDFPQLYHLRATLQALYLTPLGRILAERQGLAPILIMQRALRCVAEGRA